MSKQGAETRRTKHQKRYTYHFPLPCQSIGPKRSSSPVNGGMKAMPCENPMGANLMTTRIGKIKKNARTEENREWTSLADSLLPLLEPDSSARGVDETSLTRLRSLRQRMLEEERTVSKELCGRDGSGAGEPVAGYVGLVVPLTSGCASHGVESVIRKTRTAPHPHRCGRVPEDL